MSDHFKNHATGLTSPVTRSFQITPNDAADLPVVTRGLYIGGTGSVRMLLADDDTPVTYSAMVAGMTHAKRIRRIYATGTTATNLIGEY